MVLILFDFLLSYHYYLKSLGFILLYPWTSQANYFRVCRPSSVLLAFLFYLGYRLFLSYPFRVFIIILLDDSPSFVWQTTFNF